MLQVRTWESGICFQESYLRIQNIQVHGKNKLHYDPFCILLLVFYFDYILHMLTVFLPSIVFVHSSDLASERMYEVTNAM